LNLVITGLINKLAANNVVEKRNDDIVFTKAFSSFMLKCIGDGVLISTAGKYRKVLGHYESNLEFLSDTEIRAVMVLLGFYMENVGEGMSAGA
jgi:hypothetical protein